MNREFCKNGVKVFLSNYTPKKNEYEKGLKYRVCVFESGVTYRPTGYLFSTIKDAKAWFDKNYFIFM